MDWLCGKRYSAAIDETMQISDFTFAPWTIVLSSDKKRARIAAIQKVLLTIDYKDRDLTAIGSIDATICGGPEIRPK